MFPRGVESVAWLKSRWSLRPHSPGRVSAQGERKAGSGWSPRRQAEEEGPRVVPRAAIAPVGPLPPADSTSEEQMQARGSHPAVTPQAAAALSQ